MVNPSITLASYKRFGVPATLTLQDPVVAQPLEECSARRSRGEACGREDAWAVDQTAETSLAGASKGLICHG